MPDHAMLALGALSSLASSSKVAPAQKAAVEQLCFSTHERRPGLASHWKGKEGVFRARLLGKRVVLIGVL